MLANTRQNHADARLLVSIDLALVALLQMTHGGARGRTCFRTRYLDHTFAPGAEVGGVASSDSVTARRRCYNGGRWVIADTRWVEP